MTGERAGRPVLWWRNPRHVIPPAWHQVVALWSRSRGGMGVGWLPQAGGQSEQAAWLWHAFDVLATEDKRLSDKATRKDR